MTARALENKNIEPLNNLLQNNKIRGKFSDTSNVIKGQEIKGEESR